MINHCFKRLSFCTWNINGINSKLIGDKTKCVDFLNQVTKHDFIILTETWSTSVPKVEGYNCISLDIKYPKKNKRISGGISLLYKECYKNKVELVKSSNNSLWCSIEKHSVY